MTHTITTAFRSDSVVVTDFQCDGCDTTRPVEECAFAHELSITRKGAWLRRSAQGEHLADATRVMFFNDGVHYEVAHPVGGGDHCTVISYAPATLDDVATELGIPLDVESSPFTAPWSAASVQLQLLVRQLDVTLRPDAADALACEDLCLQILANALRTATSEDRARRRIDRACGMRHQTLARDALIEMARRFREPLHLADLALALGCSPFHLARVFKEQTGESIHQRVMELRLTAALEQIANSAEPVGSIAHELGFSDHAHLSAAFARRYRISPSKLRRSLQAELPHSEG
jgi:AraC family transcriptional regulator